MRPFLFNGLKGRRGTGTSDSAIVLVSDQSLSTTKIDSGAAFCSITFGDDRTITVVADQSAAETHWVTADGTPSGYDIRVTPISGTFSSGSDVVSTWVNLGADRIWQVSKGGASSGSKSCTATYEIRNATTLVVLETATITITAFVEVG